MVDPGQLEAKRLQQLAAKRLRMLRRGRGWSAERLAQESEKIGVSSLPRGTIAKIESKRREIKASEVEGVARVFGLTSADLLDPVGRGVYLSYADEDAPIGREIADWLQDHGFRVLPADHAAASSGTHQAINAVNAFVLLLSSSFLSSPRRGEELDLALRRREQLLVEGHVPDFIHVIKIAHTDTDSSQLQDLPTVDLTTVNRANERDALLSQLGSTILSADPTAVPQAESSNRSQCNHAFLDRDDELDAVLHGLRSPAGPHFWLIVSPPGLGKSCFLRRLQGEAAEERDLRAVTRLVDLRLDATDVYHDAMVVLREFFDLQPPPGPEPADDLLRIAQRIIRTGRPYLCLLDSAELLPASVATELRRHLSQVYRLVEDTGNTDARFAFVVASRRDDGWRGVRPDPRFTVLPLAELQADTIQDALGDLGLRMRQHHSSGELREDTTLLQRATEGVPELVQKSLQWIQDEEWLQIERLESPQLFAKNVAPYIHDQLLAPESLRPAEGEKSSEEILSLLQQTLEHLVAYRFFTLSHLRELENDPSFHSARLNASWSLDDLWSGISETALLSRPLHQPWQEIHRAIRRLLFLYFYPESQRADAHRKACNFMQNWADQQVGQEQIIGIVECIWHEAAILRLDNSKETEDILIRSAQKRLQAIRPSAFTVTELRNYAAERMMEDDELRREVAHIDGLFERIIEIVQTSSDAIESS